MRIARSMLPLLKISLTSNPIPTKRSNIVVSGYFIKFHSFFQVQTFFISLTNSAIIRFLIILNKLNYHPSLAFEFAYFKYNWVRTCWLITRTILS